MEVHWAASHKAELLWAASYPQAPLSPNLPPVRRFSLCRGILGGLCLERRISVPSHIRSFVGLLRMRPPALGFSRSSIGRQEVLRSGDSLGNNTYPGSGALLVCYAPFPCTCFPRLLQYPGAPHLDCPARCNFGCADTFPLCYVCDFMRVSASVK